MVCSIRSPRAFFLFFFALPKRQGRRCPDCYKSQPILTFRSFCFRSRLASSSFGRCTCSKMRFLHSLSLPLLGTSVLAHVLPPKSTHQNFVRSTPYEVKEAPLTTSWTDKAGTNPWPEYPRPQLQRTEWQNLNGLWQYQNASGLNAAQSPPTGQNLANEVLVPSCLESSLSGMCGDRRLPLWSKDVLTA